jgi:3-oxoacyl-[acyl-carrier protein] reductase
MVGMSLQNKVAIVTGSGRGIGAACAKFLAKEGAKVVLNYYRNRESAEATQAAIESAGGVAIVVQADVMTEAGAKSLAQSAMERYGSIDILVSNAGPVFGAIPLEQLTWEAFSDILNRDMQAAFFSTKAVLDTMVQNRYGRIVYIGSESSARPTPGFAHHGSARAALSTFARYVAKEMGLKGITANVVSPGMVDTDRTKQHTEFIQRVSRFTPVGRIATPEDVAKAVSFFASDESGFYTGTYFEVDGGLHLG